MTQKIHTWALSIVIKFMFSKKATKFDKIFTDDLKLCSKCQIDAEDFINFCGMNFNMAFFGNISSHSFLEGPVLVR